MKKLMIAIAATAVLEMLVSAAAAADAPGTHHRTHHRTRHHVRVNAGAAASSDVEANPAIRDGYIMNGAFDWRRRGEHAPWYAHGYSDDCVAWSQNAYHYACDPNSRY